MDRSDHRARCEEGRRGDGRGALRSVARRVPCAPVAEGIRGFPAGQFFPAGAVREFAAAAQSPSGQLADGTEGRGHFVPPLSGRDLSEHLEQLHEVPRSRRNDNWPCNADGERPDGPDGGGWCADAEESCERRGAGEGSGFECARGGKDGNAVCRQTGRRCCAACSTRTRSRQGFRAEKSERDGVLFPAPDRARGRLGGDGVHHARGADDLEIHGLRARPRSARGVHRGQGDHGEGDHGAAESAALSARGRCAGVHGEGVQPVADAPAGLGAARALGCAHRQAGGCAV